MDTGGLGIPTSLTLHKETISVRGKVANGSSCEVYKAVTKDGTEVALKVVPIHQEHPSLRARFLREIECLKRVSGQQNIVRLIDYREHERLKMGLLLEEFCSQGSLKDMCKRQELSDSQVFTVLKDICCALCQLHNRGIAHRDLRPGNILIGNDYRCRLADFASASTTFYESLSESDLPAVLDDIETYTSPVFRAPEQMAVKPGVSLTSKVDMWGLGCLLYGLLFREAPFHSHSAADHRAGRYKPPARAIQEFWIEVLNVLFIPDPRQRASAEDVLAMCIQSEIPNQIAVPGSTVSKVSPVSLRDFFITSTGSWVKAATSNFDAPPDPHYVNKLLSKAWQKPFKIDKFYQSLHKRPLHKTRVAIKALMLVHHYILQGPPESLSQFDSNGKRLFATIDSTWHPLSRQPFDDLYCEYFAGLVRQYSKVLKMKIALHYSSGLQGDWRKLRNLKRDCLGDMLTYWMKLVGITGGLLIDVSELPQLRASLANLLMQEKFRLMRVVAAALCELIRDESSSALIPELLTRFQQNYQQTRTLALTLKRSRPLLSFDAPSEELPEDLAKLVDLRRRPPPTNRFASSHVLTAEEEILNYISQFQDKKCKPEEPSQPVDYQNDEDLPAPPEEEKAPADPPDLLNFDIVPTPTNGVDPTQFTKSGFPDPITGFMVTANPAAVPTDTPQNPFSALESVDFIPNAVPSMSDLLLPVRSEARFPDILNPANEAWVIKVADLQTGAVIGMGASCTVYRGMYKRTPVAIKVMRGSMNVTLKKEFSREITALLRIRHPNLVLFMGACLDPQMSIITEYCAGQSLFKLLHERKEVMLSWRQRVKMCKDIAQGMHYLHESDPPILHRDLKSLNLLLHEPVNSPSDSVTVKITDFGISRVMGGDAMMTGQMGTCHWMAPEVLACQSYGLPADVYSYGIVLWEVACRETPYSQLPPIAIADRVLNHGERPSLSSVPPACPPALKDLMPRCWHSDPRRRPTFPEILDVLDSL